MILNLALDDPYEIDTYTHAMGYSAALSEIRDHLRDRMKYGELPAEAYEELEKARAIIFESIERYHLPNDL